MPRRLTRGLRRAAHLSPIDWRYLAVAVGELGIARARHAIQPAGQIVRMLRDAAPPAGSASRDLDLARLSWAISVAAARVPWRSDCLLQAMAADHWLRRHGLQPEFFLGVATDDGFKAHAWLRHDGRTITGGANEDFTTLIAPGPTKEAFDVAARARGHQLMIADTPRDVAGPAISAIERR